MKGKPGAEEGLDPVRWFEEHYVDAAEEILAFLNSDGITLEGKYVADIGCGDGVIDLGVALKGGPEKLVGYDLRPVDVEGLSRAASAAGVDEIPENLSFMQSEPERIPSENDRFDVVVTWSAFEHVDDPTGLLTEIRRILKPDGVLFLQLWPFWFSEHGGHLWLSYDEPFPHLRRENSQVLDEIAGNRATDPTRSAEDEYRSLNRLTLDQLQLALLSCGLVTTKLKLLTEAVHIPLQLSHLPLRDVGIGGIELLAVPKG